MSRTVPSQRDKLFGDVLIDGTVPLGVPAVTLDDEPPSCQVGRIYSDYRIEALIAQGGVAEVYRAEHDVMKRRVAFKVVKRQFRHRSDWVERMEQEARMLAEISHPNVVQIFDAGTDPHVGLYIVMELLKGFSLRALMHKSGPMLLDDAMVIGVAIAEATAALHALGICHRDIKPENVIVEPCEEHRFALKLLDLGAARGSHSLRNRERTPFGTTKYMSPEQLRGEETTSAADQYALGHILYEMLLGRHAFADVGDASPEAVARAHLQTDPAPLTALVARFPRDLWSVLARSMAKSPERRFPSIGEMAQAMRDVSLRQASMSPESIAWLALAAPFVEGDEPKALAMTQTLCEIAESAAIEPTAIGSLDATLTTPSLQESDLATAGSNGLTLEQYASLSAELAMAPHDEVRILARYHLEGAGAKRSLDQDWRAIFRDRPELRRRFAQLLGDYARWLAERSQ
jgi:serine/threonine protein kinase